MQYSKEIFSLSIWSIQSNATKEARHNNSPKSWFLASWSQCMQSPDCTTFYSHFNQVMLKAKTDSSSIVQMGRKKVHYLCAAIVYTALKDSCPFCSGKWRGNKALFILGCQKIFLRTCSHWYQSRTACRIKTYAISSTHVFREKTKQSSQHHFTYFVGSHDLFLLIRKYIFSQHAWTKWIAAIPRKKNE